MKDLRCTGCNHKLARAKAEGLVEIKCRKCKRIVLFELTNADNSGKIIAR